MLIYMCVFIYLYSEVLVSFGKPFEITRNDFLSLGEPTFAISSGIIDCWALLLNENQKSSAHVPQKLYFGVSQSIFVPILLSEHFFLIVVNLKEEKLQFIDNMSYDTKYMSEVEKSSDVLVKM
ncbi:uncharacterized protein LOC110705984 [Chenopodium quinoa]|uniref:uncharacterized protein LOC110705984 n=1 Tax=Chenopodium quinoa TaxID=63459 RepID=UPI000B795661|nr:uncharacterized protein LOC110705984 [Chenopodium quinoa]